MACVCVGDECHWVHPYTPFDCSTFDVHECMSFEAPFDPVFGNPMRDDEVGVRARMMPNLR